MCDYVFYVIPSFLRFPGGAETRIPESSRRRPTSIPCAPVLSAGCWPLAFLEKNSACSVFANTAKTKKHVTLLCDFSFFCFSMFFFPRMHKMQAPGV